AGLNTPSHSCCASLDALAPTTSCFGLLHRKNDNQSFFLANYQLRHTQKYRVFSLRAIILYHRDIQKSIGFIKNNNKSDKFPQNCKKGDAELMVFVDVAKSLVKNDAVQVFK
ncbi:MAG: hypothetical protein J6Q69_01705, partial [Clostridia bacterium]|nr:hypothetical protein [Clostridia bacterium]